MRRGDKAHEMEDQDWETNQAAEEIEQQTNPTVPVEQLEFDEVGFRAYLMKI